MPNNYNLSDSNRMPELLELGEFRNIPWLKKISRLEKILWIFIVASLLMIVVMVITISVFAHFHKNTTDTLDEVLSAEKTRSNLCLTPECIHAASEILSRLDEDVDPCQDFYRFACGGYLDRTTLAEDKTLTNDMDKLGDKLMLKLQNILETELDSTEPSYMKKAKDLYSTCMDLKTIEEAGAEPLNKILKAVGGWPVVEGSNWDDSNFDWIDTLIAIRKYGYTHSILLRMAPSADFDNNTINNLELGEINLGVPNRGFLIQGLQNPGTAAYYKTMVKSAKLLGADEAAAENELLKALQFEMTLASYMLSPEEMQDIQKMLNKYTVKQLQEKVPQIPWIKYFSSLLKTEIYENDLVKVTNPRFVKNFGDLITKTEKRVIANYILWRVVFQSLQDLSKEFRDIETEYQLVYGVKQPPRWKQCITTVNDQLGIALSSSYVRHYFDENNRIGANELVKYVFDEFLHILHEVDWMDEQTKRLAVEKALAMKMYIGYPKELLDDSAVTEVYENVSISSESYFENIRRGDARFLDKALSKLRELNIKGRWVDHAKASKVDAFYTVDNTIVFSASMLQNPFFNKDRPYYLNFGKLGSVFGHEVTHGFDARGRRFTKDGNIINWWAEETDKLFTEKAQCMVEQYSNYTTKTGIRLNGLTTLSENIADNGGFKEAYWAYHSWVKDKGEEKLLPGLNYNQNQLFWISGANWFCTKVRPEAVQFRMLTDSHASEDFRIIGSFSNLEEFSKDFKCSPDSPMNRRHKCKVW